MNTMKLTAASTAIMLLLAAPAVRADVTLPIPPDELNNHPRIAVIAADHLVGRSLRDNHHQAAGTINSLIVETTTGLVEFLLINPPAPMKTHGLLIAIPWAEFATPAGDVGPLNLKVSLATLAGAPRIDPRLIFELGRPAERDQMFGYYGTRYPGALGIDNSSGNNRENNLGAHDRQVALEEHRGMVPDGTAKPPIGTSLVLAEDGVIAKLSVLTTTSTAAMDDSSVYDSAGKDIGDLDATMIDVVHGRVAYVLVSHGGFLGMDESLSAAPIEALSLSPYRDSYRLTVSMDVLEHEPALHVIHGELPSSVSAAQLGMLYQRFGIQPYWTTTSQQTGRTEPKG